MHEVGLGNQLFTQLVVVWRCAEIKIATESYYAEIIVH